MTTVLVLVPGSKLSPKSISSERMTAISPDGLIADLRAFPPSAHEFRPGGACRNITAEVVPPTDYWSIARQWLIQMTERTGLQDILQVDGYGFWLSLRGQHFVPGNSAIGNSFAQIDLLTAIKDAASPDRIVVHGEENSTAFLIEQVFDRAEIEFRVEDEAEPRERRTPPRKLALILARILVSMLYLAYSLVQPPHICFFSTTSLVRRQTRAESAGLRDVYLDSIIERLRQRGWRTVVVEKSAWNASWEGLRARGLFFPNDLLFAVATAIVRLRLPIVRKWEAEWRAAQDMIQKHLRYRGYDITPLVQPVVARSFTRDGPRLETLAQMWQMLLRFWQPEMLFINNSYGLSAMPAIIASKAMSVLTIEQQHGVINKEHVPYLAVRRVQTSTKAPLCDRMVVWGDYFKRLLIGADAYTPSEVVVCGFPRIDTLTDDLPPRQATLTELGIPVGAQVVLYTSNRIARGFRSSILDSIGSETSRCQVQWIIKLHPAEQTRQAWQTAVEQRGLSSEVRIVQHEIDFYALLAACDIHVSLTSTTLLEAAILNKVNLGLALAGLPDPVGYADAGAYLPVHPESLGQTACDILQDGGLREKVLHTQTAFAADWCLHDGHSVRRVVDLIETVAKESSAGRR